MPENESDYKVGPGRPPLHTRFKKGQSGNPGGRRSAKTLPALLAAALDETVYVTTNGRRRKLTKREAIIAQMVDKSASADLRATKMLIDMMKEVEHKAGAAAPPPEPRPLADADQEVVQQFVARLRRQILQEIEVRKATPRPDSFTERSSPSPALQPLTWRMAVRDPAFRAAGMVSALPQVNVGRNSEAHSAKPSGNAADYAPLIRPTLAFV